MYPVCAKPINAVINCSLLLKQHPECKINEKLLKGLLLVQPDFRMKTYRALVHA